jgi:hypothetical protein
MFQSIKSYYLIVLYRNSFAYIINLFMQLHLCNIKYIF